VLKKAFTLVWLVILSLHSQTVAAQGGSDELALRLDRNFGYRSGARIQGAFTLRAEGPANLVQVTFLMDAQTLAVVHEAPFQISFSTSDHALGPHTLYAIGVTSGGGELRSESLNYTFISAEQGWREALRLLVPLLGGLLLLIGLGMGLMAVLGRKRGSFQLGSYGIAGGAVCPRCELPFSRHLLVPNLLVGKLERCPHCDRWTLVARAAPAELTAAEARYQDQLTGEAPARVDPAEKLRRSLEDSRFESTDRL
jgi:hypothetical protein